MKKLALAALLIATTSRGDLIFEDPFIQFDLNKPLVVQDFADGLTGGAVSKGHEIVKKAGEATAKAMESHGFHNSGIRRSKMERATRAAGAVHPAPSKVYLRGGRHTSFL